MEVNSRHIIIHGQLRDLGRELVHKEGCDNIGLCSRLWLQEEAIEVIERNQGTPNVQALILQPPLDDYKAIHCTSQQFEGMTNLRFLRMKNVQLTGDFEYLFLNLRWLRWFPYSSMQSDVMGINFNPKKLVFLHLEGSNITEHWKSWSQMKFLKVLKLERCNDLTTTPDFSLLKELEVLILNNCRNLRKIHPSIGILSKTLRVLKIRDCEELEELPIEVGKMEELRYLLIDWIGIKGIPISEGYMTKLEKLLVKVCTQLTHIPNSLGSLVRLKHLELYNCQSFTKIPESIGKLRLLIKLDLGETGVKELPYSIGELCNLEELLMCGNPIKCLPPSIGMLSNLLELDLDRCKELESLPNLPSSLMSLNFHGDSMETLPDFSNLANLNRLTFRDLFERRNRALNLENLNQLKALWIQHTNINYTWKGFDSEEEIKISNLAEEIDITSKNFSLQLELPVSLEELRIYGCPTLHTLPSLSNLKSLSMLCLKDCSELVEINGLEGVESLMHLELERCRKLYKFGGLSHLKMLTMLSLHACEKLSDVQGIEKLTSLTHLSFSQCHAKIKFPNLSMLRNLECLKINYEGLVEIPGLQELKSLEDLNISRCKLFQYLPNLSQFTNLWKLNVMHCENLTEIRGFHELKSLKELNISGCKSLQYLPNFSQFTNLRKLNVSHCENLTEIQGLENLTSLKLIYLGGCNAFLPDLPNVEIRYGPHESEEE